jgi:hypothetical protein
VSEAPQPEPELLTVTKAAHLLRVHPRDILAAVAEGTLPWRDLGRPYFVRQELLGLLATPHPDSSTEG